MQNTKQYIDIRLRDKSEVVALICKIQRATGIEFEQITSIYEDVSKIGDTLVVDYTENILYLDSIDGCESMSIEEYLKTMQND